MPEMTVEEALQVTKDGLMDQEAQERLAAEVERLNAIIVSLRATFDHALLLASQGEVERLRARLAAAEKVAEYAEHGTRCAHRLTWRGVGEGIPEPKPCDCGVIEAMAEWRKASGRVEIESCRRCGVDLSKSEHRGGCPERDVDDYQGR